MDIKDLIKQSSQNLAVERKQTVQQQKQDFINKEREREKKARLMAANVNKFRQAYRKYNSLDETLSDLCEKLLIIYGYADLPVNDKYIEQVGRLLGEMKQHLDVLIELEDYSFFALDFNQAASFYPWILKEAHLLSIYINMHDLAGGGEKFFALMSNMASATKE